MSADTGAATGGAALAGGGPEAALVGLGRAISRAAEALAAIPGDDDVTAYKCSRALDSALGDLADLLREAPRVVGLGEPGHAVSERVEQRRAEVATRRGEITSYRERLDELAENEQDLAEVTAEASGLRERISELERAERLASEIPSLRVRMKALEESVAAAGAADAPEIGARIAEAAGQLAALTGPHREAAGESADKLIADAEQAARELDEQRARRDAAAAELAKRESDAQRMHADFGEMVPVLTAWRQADADLAEALRAGGFGAGASAAATVVSELNDIRQRLSDLDDTLRPLLADHTGAYEEARRARPM